MRYLLFCVLTACPNLTATDFLDSLMKLSKEPKFTALLVLSFVPHVLADNIVVTDEWSYNVTNAQTVLGGIGLLTMGSNFLVSWWYYRKMQSDEAISLRARAKDFEERAPRHDESRESLSEIVIEAPEGGGA